MHMYNNTAMQSLTICYPHKYKAQFDAQFRLTIIIYMVQKTYYKQHIYNKSYITSTNTLESLYM